MATVAGTINLQGCNYQLQYDIVSQSIENNTTTVKLYGVLNVTNNQISWDRSNKVWVHYAESPYFGTYYTNGSHTLIEGEFTFTHDENGDLTQNIGYGIDTTFIKGSSSANIPFPHINRASQPSCITWPQTTRDVGNIGDTITIHMNRKNTNYYHTVTCSWYNKNITIATNVADSCQWTIPLNFAEDIPNKTQSWGTIYAHTYYNGTLIGVRSVEFDCHVANANPIFSDFDFEDINEVTANLTGGTTNNVINVNSYSTIEATITTTNKAQPQMYANMVKYRLAIGDSSQDIPYSDENDVSGYIQATSGGVYNLYAIDSRNNSTLVTKQAVSVINYQKITLDKQNCSFIRDDNQVGENAILTLSGTFWNDNFGQVVNSIKEVSYKLKKSDSSTWIDGTTTITPTISGNNFTFTGLIASDNQDTTWDLDSSYNLQVIVQDELSSTMVELILNSAVPTMSLDKNGVGIMCAYDSNLGGLLQIGGEKIFDSGNDYIKYSDGTAIVWGTTTISFSATSSTYNTINLPITFKNTNYIVEETISKLFSYHTSITLHPGTRTTITCQIGGWNDLTSTVNGYVDYIIIGKWK